jgi:mannan endo-1,4-beta-mannosidase
VLTWRNAWDRPGHYYAPWPGSPDAEDFIAFAASGKVKLLDK